MGEDANTVRPKRTRRAAAERESRLSDFVADRAPDVYITFLSILIGIVLADLLQEVRERVTLWPLDATTLRTWGQIGGTAGSALGTWAIYAHLSIVQRRVPTFFESLAAFAGPMVLLLVDSFVGRPGGAPWFYAASGFLFIGLWASVFSIRSVAQAEEGAAFRRLLRPNGYLIILLIGAPAYTLSGVATQLGWMPVWAQALATLSTIPAAVVLPLLYFRDWNQALGLGPSTSRRATAPALKGKTVVEGWAREKVPDVFVTLLSVTFGLAMQNIVDQARERMVLWPLSADAILFWGQIAAMMSSGMSGWLISSHLAISRRGLPSYAQTLNAALVPLFLLTIGGLAGRELVWPWLYAAGGYLIIAALTARWFLHFAADEDERKLLMATIRPTGFMIILYGGAPIYLAGGILGQLGFLPTWMEFALVLGGPVAAMVCTWLFFRDWRRALDGTGPLA